MIEILCGIHRTSARVRVAPDAPLPAATFARVQRALCGVSGCRCGGVFGATVTATGPDGEALVTLPTVTRYTTGRRKVRNLELADTASLTPVSEVAP